jgi:hypothetical protein
MGCRGSEYNRARSWAVAAALALSACAGGAPDDQITVIAVSQGDPAPQAGMTLTLAPASRASATAAPVHLTAAVEPDGVADTRPPTPDAPCTAIEQRRCERGIGSLDACNRCRAHSQPHCGDGVCADNETDATCGADCGCAAEGHDCGTVAPFGCYCDSHCAATGDCCADAELICRASGTSLAALDPERR